jgi:hypothetical protein
MEISFVLKDHLFSWIFQRKVSYASLKGKLYIKVLILAYNINYKVRKKLPSTRI